MKKIIKKISAVILTLIILALPLSKLSAESVSWYTKREKDHKTPALPSDLSFITKYGGYGVDERHNDYSSSDKVLYLTFDVGYENGNVEKILDVLKEEEVSAAFFVLGNLIERNTDLVIRMADEGHLVCNHTYSHHDMSKVGKDELLAELKKLETVYWEKTGKKLAPYYRPPEGRFSSSNLEAAMEAGYSTVFWSFAYADWDNNHQIEPRKAKARICDHLHNGEIMLLHPTSETNAAILGDVIRFAKLEGFRFGTLDELTGKEESKQTAELDDGYAKVYRYKRNDNMKIALTFDDGPHPTLTQEILDILDRYDVRATFFMIGENVAQYPDIAKEVIERGHEIGNHTASHSYTGRMEEEELLREITDCENIFFNILGCETSLLRPPEGVVPDSLLRLCGSLEYSVILWNIDTRDWAHPSPSKISKTVVSQVRAGDIILMHDYIGKKSPTPAALEIFLPRLLEMGYSFVTVSELIGDEG